MRVLFACAELTALLPGCCYGVLTGCQDVNMHLLGGCGGFQGVAMYVTYLLALIPEEVAAGGEDTAVARQRLVLHADAEVEQRAPLAEGLKDSEHLLTV